MKRSFSLCLGVCFVLLQTGFINHTALSRNGLIMGNRNPIAATKGNDSFSYSGDTSMKLWYTQPAKQWMLQALPIGNGSVGAMIFGGIEKEHLQFNEKSLWSGKKLSVSNPMYRQKMDSVKLLLALGRVVEADVLLKAAGNFPREHFGTYQPFGDVFMEFNHGDAATDYHRELDLAKALITVSYRINGVKYHREYFASFPEQVIVMRVSADQPGKINMRVTMTTPHDHGKVLSDNNFNVVIKGTMPESGIQYSSHLKINPQGGTAILNKNGIEVKNANSVVLLLAAKTNYAMTWPGCQTSVDPDHMAQKLVDHASKKTYHQLFYNHFNDYGSLFNRVQLKLDRPSNRSSLPTDEALAAYTKANQDKAPDGGDPGLEALLFHYGRYLMIAASRKGNLPANLQGLWNNSTTPAWDSDYHTDINLEMNYWLNGPVNLSECFSPFVDYVDFLRKPGRLTAKNYFNAKGFFVNIYTNPWGYAEPRWAWTGASGWLCQNLYDHFLFTGNREYLRYKAYPIMKEACSFYLDLLVRYKGKSLVVAPGISPEINFRFNDNQYYRTSAGAAIDQQIVFDLFTNTIEAAKILKSDAQLISTLEDRLKRLSPPVKIDKDERVQEWVEDWQAEDLEHRHISHLYALYPGKMIDPLNTPQWAKAARNSLALRGDNHTGWGTAWRIACYARLGDGEKAHSFFKSLLRRCVDTNIVYRNGGGTYDNLLTCHSPFQIDGNFGYTAAVAEMLLQSQKGNWETGYELDILPALPNSWKAGTVKGLKARGNIEVDMQWENNILSTLVLIPKMDATYTLRYGKIVKKIKLKRGVKVVLNGQLNS